MICKLIVERSWYKIWMRVRLLKIDTFNSGIDIAKIINPSFVLQSSIFRWRHGRSLFLKISNIQNFHIHFFAIGTIIVKVMPIQRDFLLTTYELRSELLQAVSRTVNLATGQWLLMTASPPQTARTCSIEVYWVASIRIFAICPITSFHHEVAFLFHTHIVVFRSTSSLQLHNDLDCSRPYLLYSHEWEAMWVDFE